MKKLIIIALLLMPLGVWAQQDPLAPKWEEFCPAKYLNAKGGEDPKYSRVGNVALAETIVGLPFAFHNKKKAETQAANNYWAKRKTQFDNEIILCQNTTTDKAMCYMQVRQMEASKNSDYNHLNQNAAIARQQAIQDSYRPPVQTHCNSYSGNTNCTSY